MEHSQVGDGQFVSDSFGDDAPHLGYTTGIAEGSAVPVAPSAATEGSVSAVLDMSLPQSAPEASEASEAPSGLGLVPAGDEAAEQPWAASAICSPALAGATTGLMTVAPRQPTAAEEAAVAGLASAGASPSSAVDVDEESPVTDVRRTASPLLSPIAAAAASQRPPPQSPVASRPGATRSSQMRELLSTLSASLEQDKLPGREGKGAWRDAHEQRVREFKIGASARDSSLNAR